MPVCEQPWSLCVCDVISVCQVGRTSPIPVSLGERVDVGSRVSHLGQLQGSITSSEYLKVIEICVKV